MARIKTSYIISVDSESGTYWHGQRRMQTQAQVSAAIKQEDIEQTSAKNHANLGKTSPKLMAIKILRTSGSFFGKKYLRLN